MLATEIQLVYTLDLGSKEVKDRRSKSREVGVARKERTIQL